MALFADRSAAGRELAESLQPWAGQDAVVFGIPRGGVVVAATVARALGLPLAAAVVRKLGAPSHEEFAVGAIAGDVRVLNDAALRAGHVTQHPDDLRTWALALQRRKGHNVAAVALANKLARVCWRVWRDQRPFERRDGAQEVFPPR